MKRFFLVSLIINSLLIITYAQAPQYFKYQTEILDSKGIACKNKIVNIEVSILKASITGRTIYSETFKDTTNFSGLINIDVGKGKAVTGKFSDIVWGIDDLFLKVEADTGTTYKLLSISKILSVPYAQNASKLTLTASDGKQWKVEVQTDGTLTTACYPLPSTANAGPDSLTAHNTTTVLQANTPDEGIGQWTIQSGAGGIISEPNNPKSAFSGIQGITYLLRWTISTKCSSNYDEVNIRFRKKFYTEGEPIIDERDGKIYKTVWIGATCWMAENLSAVTYQNGDSIPENAAGFRLGAYFNYNNNEKNVATYGRLYNWYAVYDSRGICPKGWSIPSYYDFANRLSPTLGGDDLAGGRMKAEGTIESGNGLWHSPNAGATNESGFSALPSGFRYDEGDFSAIGSYTFFWTSTPEPNYSFYNSWVAKLNYLDGTLTELYNLCGAGHAVRCLK